MSWESVNLISTRKNPEELVETCSAKNIKANLGIENLKIEDEIMEDIKDDKLIFISKEADIEDIDEDELIFKYIHKKFGTKKRECAPIVEKIDSIVLEVDPLEGTSRGTDLLNR